MISNSTWRKAVGSVKWIHTAIALAVEFARTRSIHPLVLPQTSHPTDLVIGHNTPQL